MVIGIAISPHFVEEVILNEHFGNIGDGELNFPAKLPGIVLGTRLLLASLSRIRLSISFACKNASIPEKILHITKKSNGDTEDKTIMICFKKNVSSVLV